MEQALKMYKVKPNYSGTDDYKTIMFHWEQCYGIPKEIKIIGKDLVIKCFNSS